MLQAAVVCIHQRAVITLSVAGRLLPARGRTCGRLGELSAILCSCRSPAPKRARIVEELRAGDVLCLKGDLQFHHVAKGRGPRAAIAKTGLSKCTQADRMVWLESARLEAVLGGMRLSMPSVCSGLRCYVAFVGSSLCHIRTLLDVFRACWQMQSARVPSYIFHHPSMS